MLATHAAARLGVADAHALWVDRVWNATIDILRANSVPFDRLAELLDMREIVKGGRTRCNVG
jgi:hypothetical protein